MAWYALTSASRPPAVPRTLAGPQPEEESNFQYCYALTGILTLVADGQYLIIATLAIWAFATIPQTALAVAFSVVMNAVAGPEGRYALLSRR